MFKMAKKTIPWREEKLEKLLKVLGLYQLLWISKAENVMRFQIGLEPSDAPPTTFTAGGGVNENWDRQVRDCGPDRLTRKIDLSFQVGNYC